MEIVHTTGENADFAALIKLLDDDLNERYGQFQKQYDVHNSTDNIKNVILLYIDGRPAACGAFKRCDAETIELKRIFVAKEFRGRGLSKIIVSKLEEAALAEGFRYAVLETGRRQYEAIGLYEKCGFETIPNYGVYEGNSNSICMKKKLL
ncbi:MAG TPA: GNAT family N-acetyltransferase [Clostridia bacterium]|nr:GNAT family N-acetyltransferase [Clostridia bacterium]